jgi:hypothetical protein
MNSSSSSSRAAGWACVCAIALLLSPALSQRALAYGGVWSSEGTPVSQAGQEIILVDHPDSTITAIVRIRYAGPAQDFAWVVPVPGKPTVRVSSNIVFERLKAATGPEHWLEVGADGTCLGEDADGGLDAGPYPYPEAPEPDPSAPASLVIDRGQVGPYDYAQLELDESRDDPAAAASDWLTANGYRLSGRERELLGSYLKDGLNLLAFKLTKDEDADALRPISLTYESELPMIPLRAAAAGAQDDMHVQVWIAGPSHAIASNYSALVLNDALIDWLSVERYNAGTLPAGGVGPAGPRLPRPTNYDALVTAAADEAGGRGFVTELALPASQFRDQLWSVLDAEQRAAMVPDVTADGLDLILAASVHYGSWDGWQQAVQGAITLPEGVTLDELGRDPERYRAAVVVDSATFVQLLEEHVIAPVADTAALFSNAPYLTRLFTTISADEMTVDPSFDYNLDLAQVSNVHVAKQRIDCNEERARADAPWRIELPQGGVVLGEGSSQEWPVAAGSLPANLKIVMLSTTGSGTVLEDNSAEIARKLSEAAGGAELGVRRPRPAQNGLLIGGTQTLVPHRAAAESSGRAKLARSDTCSVARVGAKTGSALATWSWLAAALFFLSRRRMAGYAACAWSLWLVMGCSDGDGRDGSATGDGGGGLGPGAMTLEQLRDPETCKDCHPIHYREWSSSMHAYAAQDPVFLAMNARGQRETNGELGDFCVKCHAPMAVVDGLTRDGLNIAELPDFQRGVSCYFCHNVAGIEGDHNAMLRLANDTTMRGPIRDPVEQGVHQAEFSEIFDPDNPKSSAMCGGCHDIVTPNGIHLERTLEEYRYGLFSKSATPGGAAFDSCVGCHMPSQRARAAVAPAGTPERQVHEHLWPGVDIALTDFPNREAMRSAVEDCQLGISVAFFTLEVTPPDLFTFQLETGAGHNQPSGSAQDRRMWLEFLAYDADGNLLEDVSSGNIADDEVEEKPKGDPNHDPQLLMFRDRIFDAHGKPVHMFWEAAKSEAYPDGYESHVLPVATTTYVEGKHAVTKQYRARGPNGELPARVTARLRMRPIGLDVLQDLVDSGDLDRAIMAEMPTFTFGAQIEWTPADGLLKTIRAQPSSDCSKYRCLLDPSSSHCK